MRKKVIIALVAVAVIFGAWFYFQSRVVKVWVYTDYAFRFQHSNWPALVDGRFREVNGMYHRGGTGVIWKVVDASQSDPTGSLPGIDARRANMVFHQDRQTDVYVILTGIREGNRTGSVNPFTNVAVIVDFPDQSETVNSGVLARELSHLFGVPQDPSLSQTFGGRQSELTSLSPKNAAIIRDMSAYPFAGGIEPLIHGPWANRAVAAIAQNDPVSGVNPRFHAETVVATALLNERKRTEAIAHFQTAVQADPRNVMAHLNLAEAYGRDGQDNMAVEQAREVVRLAPDNPMAHRALGAMLGRSHQPDAALRELRLAAGMEQPNADTQTLIGAQLAVMYGHVDEAIAAFQQALSLNPNMVVAKEGLERAQLLKSKLASEVEKQHAAVQSNPNDPDAFYRLAKAEAYSGDFAAAIRDLQKSASLRPGSGTPHAELADIYLSRGDAGSAWDEVRKARALGTEPPPTLLARLPAQ